MEVMESVSSASSSQLIRRPTLALNPSFRQGQTGANGSSAAPHALDAATRHLATFCSTMPGTTIQLTLMPETNRYDKLKHAAEEIMKEQISTKTERDLSTSKMAILEGAVRSQGEKIQRLRSEKSQLQALLDMEKTTIAKLEFENRSIQAMVDSLRSQVTSFESKVLIAQTDSKTLADRLSTFFQVVETVQTKVQETENQNAQQKQHIEDLNAQIDSLQFQNSELQGTVSVQRTEIMSMKENSSELKIVMGGLEDERKSNIVTIQNLQSALAQNEVTIQELQSQVSDLKISIEAAQNNYNSTMAQNEQLQTDLSNMQDEQSATKRELTEVRQQLVHLATSSVQSMDSLREELESEKLKVQEKDRLLDNSNAVLTAAETELARFKEEQQQIVKVIEHKDRKLLDESLEKDKMNTELTELRFQIENFQLSSTRLNDRISELTSELSAAKSLLQDSSRQLDIARDLETKNRAGQDEVTELKKHMHALLVSKDAQLEASTRQIEELQTEISRQEAVTKSRICQLESQLKVKDKQLEKKISAEQKSTKLHKDTQSRLHTAQEELQLLLSREQKNSESLDHHQQQLDDKNRQIDVQQQEIQRLYQIHQELTNSNEDLQSKVQSLHDQMDSTISNYQSRLDVVQQQYDSAQLQLHQNRSSAIRAEQIRTTPAAGTSAVPNEPTISSQTKTKFSGTIPKASPTIRPPGLMDGTASLSKAETAISSTTLTPNPTNVPIKTSSMTKEASTSVNRAGNITTIPAASTSGLKWGKPVLKQSDVAYPKAQVQEDDVVQPVKRIETKKSSAKEKPIKIVAPSNRTVTSKPKRQAAIPLTKTNKKTYDDMFDSDAFAFK